jgi:hypothetical protein
MKTLYTTFVLALVSFTVSAQTVTNQISDTIPCCNHSDSIDYNSDGVYDIRISSTYGMDNVYYYSKGIGTVKLTGVFSYGQSFNSYSSTNSIAGTTLGCSGWYSWIPGTGVKYIGFRNIVSNDTTYGWIKADFHGQQNSCGDTIVTQMVAYNLSPNDPLLAGEVITGISKETAQINPAFLIHQNEQSLIVESKTENSGSVMLLTFSGQIIFRKDCIAPMETLNIPIADMVSGIYLLTYFSNNESGSKKVVVLN